MAVSQVRQNFHTESEAYINKQINMELHASYAYMAMASHFNRDDVALHGFYKFFKESSEEEREHAQKLIEYQNRRGGRVKYQDVNKPVRQEFDSGLDAMQAALELEKAVNASLLEMHKLASRHEDAQFCDFIESEFLKEQVESIKQLGDYITNLKRVGPGLGEYMFDKETLKGDD